MYTSRWIGGTVALALLAACGCSKLTYERWQTIHVGSATPEAVEQTLGEPLQKADNTWVYNDRDRQVTAFIKFREAKVVGKEWIDPERTIETVGEKPDEPGEAEQFHMQKMK